MGSLKEKLFSLIHQIATIREFVDVMHKKNPGSTITGSLFHGDYCDAGQSFDLSRLRNFFSTCPVPVGIFWRKDTQNLKARILIIISGHFPDEKCDIIYLYTSPQVESAAQ